ncbi:MAG: GNAT family N-acetyltransferase [Desulfobacteraceae bacterium]|jgi:hypothetical protein|nr:GNAT family N-acetyltransferase [Desulfobacteraceae bacterium]
MEMDKELIIKSEKYIIRPYQAEDEDAVLSLWQTVFGKDINRDYWQWKYSKNPYGNRILLCVKETGEVVVMYSGIPYRANMDGESLEIIHLSDIMSHPDYRKTGLFIKTVEAFIAYFGGPQKAVLFYGFPGMYHFDIGRKYLEYRELSGGVQFLSVTIKDLSENDHSRGCVTRISNIDDVGKDIWPECQKYFPFSVIRDKQFLKWRFQMNPIHSYKIYGYALNPDSQLIGYAAFAQDEDTLIMVDLLMPPSLAMVQDFMAIMAAEFIKQNIKKAKTWLPANHFLNNILVSCGFDVQPEPLGFVPTGRSFSPCLPWDWGSQNMYYSMADADLF